MIYNRRKQVVLALLAALMLLTLPVRASDDPAALAAETDAAIAALGRVSLQKEADVLAARAMYDALSEDARRLVTRLPELEKAEETLLTLHDRAAGLEIRKRTSAGRYDAAIEYAEEYIGRRPPEELRADLLTYVLRAYVRKAVVMMRNEEYERAEAVLLSCRERYAGGDLTEIDRALKSLERAVAEPEDGTVLVNRIRGEYGAVTIRSGDAPALVKLVSTSDPETFLTVYLHARGETEIHVKDGTYYLRYATGERWYGEKELFGEATRFYRADAALRFSTDRVEDEVFYQSYTVVLQADPAEGEAAEAMERNDF